MKLTNKGFAITSIIYSMLVLFLALLLLIMGNLANRKVLFDKEKSDILSKINPTSAPFCILEGDKDGSGTISIGDQYVCNPGDGNKTFYVLEAGDNISLIMSENIDGETFNEGSEADAALLEKTKGWTDSRINSITHPTLQQLENQFDSYGRVPAWLYGHYFTSTEEETGSGRYRWEGNYIDYISSVGIRPVIVVSKSDIPTPTPFCILEDGDAYAVGSIYSCNPGDGYKTFYVLETGDNISLIMSENIDNELLTADSINDGAEVDEALLEKTAGWTDSRISSIALPTTEQLTGYDANERGPNELLYSWLEGYYYTLDNESLGGGRWRVEGNYLDYFSSAGIRPVITVSKSDI